MSRKILVLYYSAFGHVETLAKAVAQGARSVEGCEVDLKRVPEIVPEAVATASGYKLDQDAPIADPSELAAYDAIVFGAPTRFGNVPAQMRNFMDQTGPLWKAGSLIDKIGSVFTSTGTGAGNESTILSFWPTLAHHGMIIVGLSYASTGLYQIDEMRGGSPYGAGTVAGNGSRTPSQVELGLARDQGQRVAQLAVRLAPEDK
ncbi:NAD(P)H:quinone oxidoreductase [Hyphomonas johnsonii]|uniref:NAD(P)H dehydrogenase (quinone) n=1 Tax=Hyphomonas johnsonii MHS-2 TaxID=1280950 RepID=A0A059FE34_9PROT|nr:NAD(P)H:quinone oxidoreductase [Hyphomonas johnsonii]KCZ88857.1 NAD(P)H:quinone oxidoreductase [Hyphomonas johnsonii MHS-2]